MERIAGALLLSCCIAGLALSAFAAPPVESTIPFGDFEADTAGWRFVGGEEFPGAKGAMTRDTTAFHGDAASLKLAADFTGGGAYVGVWNEPLPDLEGKNLRAIRFWAKSEKVTELGVRITDSSGQCHQVNGRKLVADGAWHEVTVPLMDLACGEHWGGAGDGKWHGPARGFGLNIAKNSVTGGVGAVWLDDLVCVATTAQWATPTVLPATLSQASCRPGFGFDMKYRWDAQPMGRDFTIFVHILGSKGEMIAQDDHEPPGGTAVWSGKVEYEHTIVMPVDAPEGKYKVLVGLYDHAASRRGWDHQVLKPAQGVTGSEGDTTCEIATFTVDAQAPVPKLGKPTLNLDGYHVTFDEDFKDKLDVSAWGPGTRWIAHTPYSGDFGDARFADPEPGFPFTIENGMLRIEARKDEKGWRAGLLSSADPKGNGFAQKYGYFEMRAKLPKGAGTWPAFWLLGIDQLKDKSKTQIEIDVVEEYGVNSNALHSTVHLWYPDKRHWAEGRPALVQGMTDDFHTYGVMVTPDNIIFYFDRVELRRMNTPEEAKVPLYVLVNLALGGGWPIDKTPSPSDMYVDHVRVWGR